RHGQENPAGESEGEDRLRCNERIVAQARVLERIGKPAKTHPGTGSRGIHETCRGPNLASLKSCHANSRTIARSQCCAWRPRSLLTDRTAFATRARAALP